jgi:hypothetical protein
MTKRDRALGCPPTLRCAPIDPINQLLLPTEQHTCRYPIATRHLGKARARLHRLRDNAAFVRLAQFEPKRTSHGDRI